MKLLAITTGDTDGIGFEVSVKSLARLGPQKDTLFFLFRASSAPKKYLSLLDRKFKRITFNNIFDALTFSKSLQKKATIRELFDINSLESPPEWVQTAARLCHQKKFQGLVTAPLSKELIASLGWKDRGHTEILQRITKVPFIHQGFVGKYFNVVLATSHMPLKNVAGSLSQSRLSSSLQAAQELQTLLSKKRGQKPIALLGLNPHAGEAGLLGNEEQGLLVPFCLSHHLQGPLSPDAAFLEKNWEKFSVYIACYHDQGLIPFKVVHGQNSGVQVSLGLSFPRTSVDHGTAKDIFGKNKANANSMFEALQLALRMARK